MEAQRTSLTDAIWSRIPAYQNSGHSFAKRSAKSLNRLDARLAPGQTVVGDDQVRRLAERRKLGQRGTIRSGRNDAMSPASQQASQTLQCQPIVIDHDNQLGPQSSRCPLQL